MNKEVHGLAPWHPTAVGWPSVSSCAGQVPVLRATWFLKITMLDQQNKGRTRKEGRTIIIEWTTTVSEYMKKHLQDAKAAPHPGCPGSEH